jgi:hypothetical protein
MVCVRDLPDGTALNLYAYDGSNLKLETAGSCGFGPILMCKNGDEEQKIILLGSAGQGSTLVTDCILIGMHVEVLTGMGMGILPQFQKIELSYNGIPVATLKDDKKNPVTVPGSENNSKSPIVN